jgi:hypothetical protein
MRAEEMLPDDRSHRDFEGVSVRKGTVAAFLANARLWTGDSAFPEERLAAEADMSDALPALRALGLFDVLEIRDERLRHWLIQTQAQVP